MTTVRKRTPLQVWGDVIFALFVRQIRTDFNDKLGLAWTVVNPVLFVFVLSMLRGRIAGEDVHSMPVFTFFFFGLLLFQYFQRAISETSKAIRKNAPLYGFRQVQPISAAIAAAILNFIAQLLAFAVVFLIMYFLGYEIRVDIALGVIMVMLGLWLMGSSVGLSVGIASLFVPEVRTLFNTLMRPMLFISCVIYSIHDIPKEYWPYFTWNPLAQGVELARSMAYTSYSPGPMTWETFALIALGLMVFGLTFYAAFWKRSLSGR